MFVVILEQHEQNRTFLLSDTAIAWIQKIVDIKQNGVTVKICMFFILEKVYIILYLDIYIDIKFNTLCGPCLKH